MLTSLIDFLLRRKYVFLFEYEYDRYRSSGKRRVYRTSSGQEYVFLHENYNKNEVKRIIPVYEKVVIDDTYNNVCSTQFNTIMSFMPFEVVTSQNGKKIPRYTFYKA